MVHVPSQTDPSALEAAQDEAFALQSLSRSFGNRPWQQYAKACKVAETYPSSLEARLMLAQAALHANKPEVTRREVKRVRRKTIGARVPHVLNVLEVLDALALTMQGKAQAGRARLDKTGLPFEAFAKGAHLPEDDERCVEHLSGLYARLRRPPTPSAKQGSERSSAKAGQKPASNSATRDKSSRRAPPAPTRASDAKPVKARPRDEFTLERRTPELVVRSKSAKDSSFASFAQPTPGDTEREFFKLRGELAELSLFEGFDDLLCLPSLTGVDHYWYQVETARKVLKQFKGRVLLADEVGLGKTVEAGIILREYVMRGMARRVLVITPAALVGQWREEMQCKFGLEFETTQSPAFKQSPQTVWGRDRVIASIATARRSEHLSQLLDGPAWDLVIVDEAHHLKNRTSKNYALVQKLQKRFLLLLSATPVQNSLVELYNLVTLLKPGVFATERDFRESYMTRGKPRVPQNRDQLRSLMRDVMIRNTRSLVDVRLPRREALTLRPKPSPAEARCYTQLSEYLHRVTTSSQSSQYSARDRLTLKHLLSAAGSSPAAAISGLDRAIARGKLRGNEELNTLKSAYETVGHGCKTTALIDLLAKNKAEKVLVFAHHRDTLDDLHKTLAERGERVGVFHGGMSGAQKDAVVQAFAQSDTSSGLRILLSTESGGEGRNLQFCNTLVNYDLPWNPMAIEQRIGRIHRIGQTREVFIFNLAAEGTVEDALLKVLDEKINMFELVVGEIAAILGELEGEGEFGDTVYDAWTRSSSEVRARTLDAVSDGLVAARNRYDGVKALDDELFGDELEAV